ncbi:THAP domain-containing protein 2-like [Rhipicephalus microplus]|uniref:THAP domain-containing protein 2-like n=1 Tax=Rhipicephalus microplus TaxID=6941 RepID=UPI003F6AF5D5
MPYCCVPRCKSSSKQRTPGISFHEIPSDPELRAKWLKVFSRDDWTPNTLSCYSTVCNRHFGSSDLKEGCKIFKLKKDAVPSIFEEYLPYLQSPKKKERSDVSGRKREAAAPVNTPLRIRRAVESQLETPSLPRNGLPSVDVDSQDLSQMIRTASELPLPLENSASKRCISATMQVDRAVQVSSLSSVSAMVKRKWRRKERDLNAGIERLKITIDKYKRRNCKTSRKNTMCLHS